MKEKIIRNDNKKNKNIFNKYSKVIQIYYKYQKKLILLIF